MVTVPLIVAVLAGAEVSGAELAFFPPPLPPPHAVSNIPAAAANAIAAVRDLCVANIGTPYFS
jgi:hypothetical protein